MGYLPEEAIKEFQDLWKKQYGEELSYEEAEIRGESLLRLLRLISEKPGSAEDGVSSE